MEAPRHFSLGHHENPAPSSIPMHRKRGAFISTSWTLPSIRISCVLRWRLWISATRGEKRRSSLFARNSPLPHPEDDADTAFILHYV